MKFKCFNQNTRSTICAVASAIAIATVTPLAVAQESEQTAIELNIPAQPLDDALVALAQATGTQILAPDSVVAGHQAPDIAGTYTLDEALELLLAESGLFANRSRSGAIIIAQEPSEQTTAANVRASEGETNLDEIIVLGTTRLPEAIEVFPGTVRVIGQQDLDKLSAVNADLGSVLGNYIPGFSPSGSQTSGSNLDQTLRGRIPSVFIDGVPITTTLRNGRVDIRSLHPSVIDRIEIVSGSSTLYGNGGAGGIVNYITGHSQSEKGVSFTSQVGTRVSLTHAGDSLNPYGTQTVQGDLGLVDFIASATLEKTQGFFDADGKRIAPNPNRQLGLSDSLFQNYFGKIGFERNGQRLELTALYYDQAQDTDFINGVGNIAQRQPTPAVRGENSPDEEDNGSQNILFNAVYTNSDLLPATALRAQGYSLQVENTFSYSNFFPGGGQSVVKSDKFGARLDFDTDLQFLLPTGGRFLYGFDYLNDSSEQPLLDGRTFVPDVKQENFAFFGQAELPVTNRFTVSGGVRYEDFNFSVESFQALFSGANVTGGTFGFSELTYNVGGSYELIDGLRAFAGFSQGAPVAEVGRVLRSATQDIDISAFNLAPSITDSLEFGMRYAGKRLQAEVVYYRNESSLGSTVTQNAVTGEFIVVRLPEEVQGVEAILEYQFTPELRAGGSFSWIEGERDTDSDGNTDTPLSGQTIPPEKLAAFAEYNWGENWFVRGQVSYVGGRNEFPGSARFGEGEVNSRILADLFVKRASPTGTLQVGVHNLFNSDYFTHTSEIMQLTDRFSKAPGATLSIEYTVDY